MTTVAFCHVAAPAALATSLYSLDVNGAKTGNFRLVDPLDGSSTPINPDSTLGPGSWNGLARLPGNSEFAYAVNNPRPPRFEDPQTSRMARINVADGSATLFPLFDPETLGVPEIFSMGIAISPLEPSIAIATGFEVRGDFKRLIWKVHLATGTVLGEAVELSDSLLLHALDFGPDGSTLYAINDDEELVTVDPDTGVVTILGDTGIPVGPVEGLAFRPGDGTLFAIDAGRSDQLIILDPANGAVLSTIGDIGTGGPEGLAFIGACGGDVPGDTNSDCVVDIVDLNNVRNNFGATGMPVLGDTNLDGVVNVDDLNNVRNNFGATAAVPEPATLVLIGLGILVLPTRRRR